MYSFCVWLLPLSITILRFIYILRFFDIARMYKWFIPFCCWAVFHCADILQLAYRATCWWTFGLFPCFLYKWSCCEHSMHGHFSWSGMAGSDKDMFNVIRSWPTIFQTGCNSLCYPRQCVRVPVAPCLHHHLLLLAFLILALPMGLYWYVILVLILISLMTKGVEHLIGLQAICRSAFTRF